MKSDLNVSPQNGHGQGALAEELRLPCNEVLAQEVTFYTVNQENRYWGQSKWDTHALGRASWVISATPCQLFFEELLQFKICLKEGKQTFFPMDGIRHEACAVQRIYKCARKGWELLSLEIIQNYSG